MAYRKIIRKMSVVTMAFLGFVSAFATEISTGAEGKPVDLIVHG